MPRAEPNPNPLHLARALLAALDDDRAGEGIDESATNATNNTPTFAELALPWVEKRRATHRDARHDIGRMKGHLIPAFGDEPPSAITAARMRQYIDDKRSTLSSATIERTLALLSRFFNEQIEIGAPLENPVARLDPYRRRHLPLLSPRSPSRWSARESAALSPSTHAA